MTSHHHRRKQNIGVCHYHLCRKRGEVYKCKHCNELFCKEHLKAKPPGLPNFETTSHKDRLFMEEWHKPGGHPCMPYFDYWEAENKRKAEEYGLVLDKLLGKKHFEDEEVPEKEKQFIEEVHKPISKIKKQNIFSNILYRLKFWLNKRDHYSYDYSRRSTYILRLLLYVAISFIALFLFYSNIQKLNEIRIWIIQLGGTLVLIALFFSLKYSYKILKEIINWFKRQKN